jgi:hypothetical protein
MKVASSVSQFGEETFHGMDSVKKLEAICQEVSEFMHNFSYRDIKMVIIDCSR